MTIDYNKYNNFYITNYVKEKIKTNVSIDKITSAKLQGSVK